MPEARSDGGSSSAEIPFSLMTPAWVELIQSNSDSKLKYNGVLFQTHWNGYTSQNQKIMC